jgi:hypothetical protein
MAIIIKGPDGASVSFPEGTDEATINHAMAQAYPKGGDQTKTPNVPTAGVPVSTSAPAKENPSQSHSDFGLGLWEGAKLPIDNASVAVEAGLRKIGVPVDKVDKWLADHGLGSGTKEGTAEAMRAKDISYLKEQRAKGRNPSVAGNIVGAIPASVATALVTRNPLLMGGAMGALESEADDAKGVAKDTAFGAAFGKVGSVAARGAAAVAKPVFKPIVNKLLQAGVKLTPGQMTGGTLKMVEDATSKTVPIIGDVVDHAHDRAVQSFNVAAYNRALQPLGKSFPKGVKVGHEGVAHVQEQFKNTYDALYPKMVVQYDQGLQNDISGVLKNAQRLLPTDQARIFANTVEDEVVRPLMTGQRGGSTALFGRRVPVRGVSNSNVPVVPGAGPQQATRVVGGPQPGQIQMPTMKAIDERLNYLYKQYARSDDPHNQRFAEYLMDVKGAVHDAAARFNPKIAAQLKKVDQGYSILARIEPAAARAPGGVFTGSQLATTVKNADLSVRKRATAAGQAKLQDLADAGRQVLRPSIGNSGTAARHVVGAGLGAALFGKSLGLSVNPLALGAVAGALAPYTRVGGNVVRAALTKRPPGAMAVRKVLEKAAVPASIVTPITAQRKRGT